MSNISVPSFHLTTSFPSPQPKQHHLVSNTTWSATPPGQQHHLVSNAAWSETCPTTHWAFHEQHCKCFLCVFCFLILPFLPECWAYLSPTATDTSHLPIGSCASININKQAISVESPILIIFPYRHICPPLQARAG